MELRLVLTVTDFDQALTFYRDALGLEELPDPGRIGPIGLKARKTYEKHLTLGKFAEEFLNYLSAVFMPSDLEELSGIESVEFQHF